MRIRLILFFAVCFFSFACGNIEKINKGNEIASKIEQFRSENRRLPNSLSEIGFAETETGPVHYKKVSEQKFILWFGKELGESEVYDSETKQWK